MSQGPKTRSRERIIPIQIEEDAPIVTSTTNTKAKPSKSKEPEEIQITSDESNGANEIVFNLSVNSSESGNNIAEDNQFVELPKRTLASHNVPEKIIIILDQAVDENSSNFQMTSGKQYPPLLMLQHALKIFLYHKNAIDPKHEFALMVLNENTATWIHDFTNCPEDIIAALLTVTPCEPEDIFDLNTVFDLINKHVTIHPIMEDLLIPPTYVVRTVLLYGRSYSIPTFKPTEEIQNLLESPYFTFDVIMTHEPPSSGNHCNKIFETLQEIDTKGFSYSFSVSRNSSELHQSMAKILSHPLQRAPLSIARYNIQHN